MLMMSLLVVISASPRSIAQSLFIDPSEDPFLDPYIETLLHMDTKDIMGTPTRGEHSVFLRMNLLASDCL
jgi:hypothetical protein